jgi:glycerol-3-phosphate acyltransferase PlsX
MKIAVDAMGGDFGPQVTVEGAIRAAEEYDVDIVLVGVGSVIRKEVDKFGAAGGRVTICDAPEAIGMGEGLLSFRKKGLSSIRVGTELVRNGEAGAFISMGNTAAVVYISRKTIGALKGVDKPALALLLPNMRGVTLLIDVGANANCRPHHLVQFAVMGKIFMETALGLSSPRIGLMSIGEEKSKGNDLTKEAFDLLQDSPLNFVGNMEGKDIYSGKADIIVSDGFTGNVALKVSEGVVESLFSMVRNEVMKNLFAKVGLLLMKRNLKKVYKKVDYSEYGGAHLLGLNGVCIIGHGRSNVRAVKNAVRMSREFVMNRIQDRIQNEMARFEHAVPGVNG